MMFRWVKALPFGVMLVHKVMYETEQEALQDKERLGAQILLFEVMSDEDIANSVSYKISVPFKE